MKIVAKTATGYLVEATATELANCAGFDGGWEHSQAQGRPPQVPDGALRIGDAIEVSPAWRYIAKLARLQEQVLASANLFEQLAQMVRAGVPDRIVRADDERAGQ